MYLPIVINTQGSQSGETACTVQRAEIHSHQAVTCALYLAMRTPPLLTRHAGTVLPVRLVGPKLNELHGCRHLLWQRQGGCWSLCCSELLLFLGCLTCLPLTTNVSVYVAVHKVLPPRWPVVRRPPRELKVPGSNPACAVIFSGSSHTSDLEIDAPVATLPGAWRYRISTGTGRPGVSIL